MFTCTWEEWALLFSDRVFCVLLVWTVVLFKPLGSLLTVWMICLIESGVLKSPTIIMLLFIFLLSALFLVYIFKCSDIGCKYLWSLNLLDRLALFFIMNDFCLTTIFNLKYIFSLIERPYFLTLNLLKSFSISSISISVCMCVFKAKWVSLSWCECDYYRLFLCGYHEAWI